MGRLSARIRGHWRAGSVLSGVLLAACTVDTSDITFVRDDAFDRGAAGNYGGQSNTGGSKGGQLNEAGTVGKAGSGSGGTSTGGSKATAGTGTGGSAQGGGAGATGGSGGEPTECLPLVGPKDEVLLDDFEDGDAEIPPVGGRRGGWYLVSDGTGTQLPMVGPNMPPNPARSGAMMTDYAMRTSGTGFTDWGALVGTVLLYGPPGRPPCPYDLSNYRGLRFYAKGMVDSEVVRVQLATAATHLVEQGGTCRADCNDHYGLEMTVPLDWTLLSADFDDLTQKGFGQEVALDLRKVINIEFAVNGSQDFDVWIDEIQFY